jgi:cytidine deaminase
VSESELIHAAWEARRRARAEFSHFQVGAAIEAETGTVYGGCNIENATYGLTVCAERVALWKALSEGENRFVRIAVVADSESLTPPCGACRQILWEFCGDVEILLANLQGKTETLRLASLLPRAFDASFLEK